MWKLYLWVPTKGWKPVGLFQVEAEARAAGEALLPLEVKLVDPDGGRELAGRMHMPTEVGPYPLPQTLLKKEAE